MKIKTQAKLLSAVSKPYDFNGNSGTSHKLRFLVEDEIFTVNSNERQVAEMQSLVGSESEAVFNLASPKETLKITLISFE